ncbi:MAG: family 16 glycosylhydrolase [Christensenellales bacterium]
MRKILFIFAGVFFSLFLIFGIYLDIADPSSVSQPDLSANNTHEAGVQPEIVPETTDAVAADTTPLSTEPAENLPTEPEEGPGILFIAVADDIAYNNELQKYLCEQTVIDGNHITITADLVEKEHISGKAESKMAFRYGTFAFRVNTIRKKGLFPAIWMLPSDEERYPEVDIYEMVGSEPYQFFSGMHYLYGETKKKDFFSYRVNSQKMNDTYVLKFEWTPEKMVWYVDDAEIGSISHNVPDVPMYLICNLAVGGSWAGTPPDRVFPESFEVEIVEFEPVEIYAR